jgi:hypothetical protein
VELFSGDVFLLNRTVKVQRFNPARSEERCNSRIGRANLTDHPSSLEVHGD